MFYILIVLPVERFRIPCHTLCCCDFDYYPSNLLKIVNITTLSTSQHVLSISETADSVALSSFYRSQRIQRDQLELPAIRKLEDSIPLARKYLSVKCHRLQHASLAPVVWDRITIVTSMESEIKPTKCGKISSFLLELFSCKDRNFTVNSSGSFQSRLAS